MSKPNGHSRGDRHRDTRDREPEDSYKSMVRSHEELVFAFKLNHYLPVVA